MSNHRKQFGALLTGQMLSLVLSFIVPLILVRLLSTNDYGLYSQFNVVLSFCTAFFALGLSSELYYSYPTAPQKDRRILIFQSFIMLLVMGFIAGALLCIPSVREYITDDTTFKQNYHYLVLSVIVSVPEIIITALYVLNNDHKISATFLPAATIIRILLIFLFYCVSPSVKSLFFAIFLSALLKFVFVVIYSIALIRRNYGDSLFDFGILKEQISYSLPLGLASSTRILLQQLDKLIILGFVSPSAYAIYSIAFYGVPGLTQVYTSISQVYIPRMVVAYKNSDQTLLALLYRSMVSKTLSYTIPIIFVIILFADSIVPFVFSEKYSASVPYFRIYLSTFFIASVGCGNILRAIGKTNKSFKAYLYSAVFVLPFTYFAIKYFNLNGAIVAAVLGNILPKIILAYYDIKMSKIPLKELYPWRDITKQFLISFITLLPFICIHVLINPNFWLSLCFISLYLVIVFSLQIYFKVFVVTYTDVIKYINKILKR